MDIGRRITAALACALALGACKGRGPGGERPLTYDGATTISRHVLDTAIPAFERKTGHRFGAVSQSGGGKGLERLFAGEVAIAGVARRLTAGELARRPWFQIIGYDAIGVFVNERSAVKGLSKAQLKAIFTGAIVNWKDVGGANAPITACTEPLRSKRNTLAVFQSAVLDDAPFGAVREEADAADCLRFVAANPAAVSFATVAYSIPGVRAVPVDGVEPAPGHVFDSSYLLSRPLLLVMRAPPTGEAAEFMDFMLSPEGQAIVGEKFIAAR